MKFFSASLLALLFTSSVMANVMPISSNMVFQAVIDDLDDFDKNKSVIDNVSEECKKLVLEKYSQCQDNYLTFELVNAPRADHEVESHCLLYQSDACKANIIEEISFPKECKAEEVKVMKHAIEYLRYVFYLFCSRDEQGQYCPITRTIEELEPLTDGELKEQTCQSPKCAEAMDKILDYWPAYFSSINNTTATYDPEFINNKRCPEKSAEVKKAEAESAATKFWSFSVVSMALSLYAFMMVLF